MQLRKYQLDAVEWGKSHDCGYFAVDMGYGKSAIMATLIDKSKPTLIIAPLRVALLTWPDELDLWRPDLTYKVLHGQTRELDMNHDVYIINYDGLQWLSKWGPEYARFFYGGTLILDEATYIGNPSSSRTKLVTTVSKIFKRRYLLSGSMIGNSIQKTWSQYNIIDKEKVLGKNITTFRREYCTPHPRIQFVWLDKPGAEKKIAEKVRHLTFRLDAKDKLGLPEMLYTQTYVELPTALFAKYEDIMQKYLTTLESGEDIAAPSAALKMMKLRQFLQGFVYDEHGTACFVHSFKFDAVEERIQCLDGKPVIVCVQFKFEIVELRRRFPDCRVINGETSGVQARQIIDDWNAGKVSVLVVHPHSLSHGVNAQFGGCNIIWLALDWDLEIYQQLNKRLHRSGQKFPVVVDHILVRNSVDEQIWDALHEHESVQKMLLEMVKENADSRALREEYERQLTEQARRRFSGVLNA